VKPAAKSKLVRNLVIAASLVGLLALGYVGWRQQDAFVQSVIRQVRVGIPIGTPRAQAEAWAVQNFKLGTIFQPTGADGGLMRWAGVPEHVDGGVVTCSAMPLDPLGQTMHRLRPNHVWVYLLLDRNGCVADYRFLSFETLRKIESEESASK
jgi:hypothetical protein